MTDAEADADESVQRAQILLVEILDHLKDETNGAAILTALGAIVVYQLDRFNQTIEQFARTLRQLKRDRDADLARQRKEN